MTMDLEPITQELLGRPDVAALKLLADVCTDVLKMYPAEGPQLPWVGYLAGESGVFAGTCAFKTPPNEDGVEIAYFTFPGHEGRGVATRMAKRLVEIAEINGVSKVRAQTLPEKNASTHILEKLGFTCIGSVQHPEDGEVWEWRLQGG
jgi:ribosomal-protein-alanine N-acetyltransferase